MATTLTIGHDLDTMTLGNMLAKSGYFQDAKEAAQAVVKVLAGQELGIGPVASMTGIYIVKGRVTLSANLMAAAIKRSGRYNYRVRELSETACEIAFFERDEQIGTSRFTMEEAVNAKLDKDWDRDTKSWKDKPTWKNFPKNMLFARAMSNGAKWYTPDIFAGPIYTPEELGAAVDEEGQVIDAEVIRTPHQIQEDPAGAVQETPAPAEPRYDRAKLVARVKALWAEERAMTDELDEQNRESDVDLDEYAVGQLIALGTAVGKRVASLRNQATLAVAAETAVETAA